MNSAHPDSRWRRVICDNRFSDRSPPLDLATVLQVKREFDPARSAKDDFA